MTSHAVGELLIGRGRELAAGPREFMAFTRNPSADSLINDLESTPHAFVLACVMDRQMKAETAWLIPLRVSERLGTFDLRKLASLSTRDAIRVMSEPEPLHRFPSRMGVLFQEAARHIADAYDGDAARIWKGQPPSAVVFRFLQFNGVGPKIATMAANILARDFKIPFSDLFSIDVSPDVHVRRVFNRLGLVRREASTEELVYAARAIHPRYPGLLDYPAWEIGRTWCRPQSPKCDECYMHSECPSAPT